MVFIVIVILLSVDVFGSVDTIQRDKIKQDIEVLEDVLNQLIIQDSPFLFSGGDQVNGIYLDGFGVMFDFESIGLLSLSDMIKRSVRTLPRIRFNTEEDNQISIHVDTDNKNDQKDGDEKVEIEKSLKKTENLIYEFFLDYASTVKSLSDNDRICINIRNNGDPEVPSQLRACATVGELANYRRGKINESKLRSQIKINRTYGTEQTRDLDILEKIFDRSLGRKTGTNIIDWDGNTRSMYLDGYGAIFFSPVSAMDRFEHIIIRKAGDLEKKLLQTEAKARSAENRLRAKEEELREHEEQVRAKEEAIRKSRSQKAEASPADPAPLAAPLPPRNFTIHNEDFDFDFDFNKAMRPTDEEIDSILTSITGKIIEILGQYGPTLRTVKKEESILVAVDIANHIWDDNRNMLYLKVKKSDVDRYAREELTFEKFKKSVDIWKD
ncbi:MAG: hypothetical protein JXR87_04870 [Candidatus Marinimicrobia bacterium]|nr:hypothetical protein [Candidatus Neomarinimicrobiota bacterium]